MKRLGFAPEAVADLREIALYIAADDPDRALTFVAELEQKATDFLFMLPSLKSPDGLDLQS